MGKDKLLEVMGVIQQGIFKMITLPVADQFQSPGRHYKFSP